MGKATPGNLHGLPDHLTVAFGHPPNKPTEEHGGLHQHEDKNEYAGGQRGANTQCAAHARKHTQSNITPRLSNKGLHSEVHARELGIRHLQWPHAQPGLQVQHSLIEGRGDSLPLRSGLQADERHDHTDRECEGEQRHCSGEPSWQDPRQSIGQRHKPGGHQQREEEREDQDLQGRNQEK